MLSSTLPSFQSKDVWHCVQNIWKHPDRFSIGAWHPGHLRVVPRMCSRDRTTSSRHACPSSQCPRQRGQALAQHTEHVCVDDEMLPRGHDGQGHSTPPSATRRRARARKSATRLSFHDPPKNSGFKCLRINRTPHACLQPMQCGSLVVPSKYVSTHRAHALCPHPPHVIRFVISSSQHTPQHPDSASILLFFIILVEIHDAACFNFSRFEKLKTK